MSTPPEHRPVPPDAQDAPAAPAVDGTASAGPAAVPTSSVKPTGAAGLSWAAATWTVPVVPGIAGTTLLRVGLAADGAAPLLLLVTILLVVAAVGVTAVVLARGRIARGVGAGLVAGSAVSAVVGLGVLR